MLTIAQVGSPTSLNQELSNTNMNKLKWIEMFLGMQNIFNGVTEEKTMDH